MDSQGRVKPTVPVAASSTGTVLEEGSAGIGDVITGRTGQWVVAPTGERVFLLDKPAETLEAASAPEKTATFQPATSWVALPPAAQQDARSEEIEEIISYVPGWVMRWGIASILATLLCGAAIAQFIRYPEVVTGSVTVSTPRPPVRLVSLQGGELELLLVKDGEPVKSGAQMAVLKSGGDFLEVLTLDTSLRGALASLDTTDTVSWSAPAPRALGHLQIPYSSLHLAISEYQAFRNDSYFAGILSALEQQVSDERRLRESLKGRLALLEEELELAKRQHGRNLELAKSGLLSTQDVERAEADHLQHMQTLEAARGEVAASDTRIAQSLGALLEARQRRGSEERALRLAVRSGIHSLSAAIETWKQTYLITSPIKGRVSLFKPLAEGQFIEPMAPFLAVVPGEGDPVATILLSPAGVGRVRPGQRVILRLDSFPETEFGTVEGRVDNVSLLMNQANDDESSRTYMVRVVLPSGLMTSYGRQLELRQEMSGTAGIITEDRSLFGRLFDRLRSAGN